jgi:hypothetical protein
MIYRNLPYHPLWKERTIIRQTEPLEEYFLEWWNDRGFYHYPNLFVTSWYGSEWPNYREDFKVSKDTYFIADSGGFQLQDEKIAAQSKVTDEQLFAWIQENADMSFIYDLPSLYRVGKRLEFLDPATFEKNAKQTAINAQKWLDLKTNKDLLLYNIAKGNNFETLNTWYKCVKDVDLDGWAIGVKPQYSPTLQALGGLFAYEFLEPKNIHYLGIAGRNVLPIIVYMSKFFKRTTCDSSSYGEGAIFRNYRNPLDFQPIPMGQRYNKLNGLPCDCPVCEVVTVDEYNAKGSMAGALIALHNLYLYIRYFESLKSIVDDEETFRRFVKSTCIQETSNAMDMIDYGLKNGTEAAAKKFLPQEKTGSLTDWTQ